MTELAKIIYVTFDNGHFHSWAFDSSSNYIYFPRINQAICLLNNKLVEDDNLLHVLKEMQPSGGGGKTTKLTPKFVREFTMETEKVDNLMHQLQQIEALQEKVELDINQCLDNDPDATPLPHVSCLH